MLAIIEWNEDTYLHPTLFKKGDRIEVDIENKGGTIITLFDQTKHYVYKSSFRVIPVDEIDMIAQKIEENKHNPEALTALAQSLRRKS